MLRHLKLLSRMRIRNPRQWVRIANFHEEQFLSAIDLHPAVVDALKLDLESAKLATSMNRSQLISLKSAAVSRLRYLDKLKSQGNYEKNGLRLSKTINLNRELLSFLAGDMTGKEFVGPETLRFVMSLFAILYPPSEKAWLDLDRYVEGHISRKVNTINLETMLDQVSTLLLWSHCVLLSQRTLGFKVEQFVIFETILKKSTTILDAVRTNLVHSPKAMPEHERQVQSRRNILRILGLMIEALTPKLFNTARDRDAVEVTCNLVLAKSVVQMCHSVLSGENIGREFEGFNVQELKILLHKIPAFVMRSNPLNDSSVVPARVGLSSEFAHLDSSFRYDNEVSPRLDEIAVQTIKQLYILIHHVLYVSEANSKSIGNSSTNFTGEVTAVILSSMKESGIVYIPLVTFVESKIIESSKFKYESEDSHLLFKSDMNKYGTDIFKYLVDLKRFDSAAFLLQTIPHEVGKLYSVLNDSAKMTVYKMLFKQMFGNGNNQREFQCSTNDLMLGLFCFSSDSKRSQTYKYFVMLEASYLETLNRLAAEAKPSVSVSEALRTMYCYSKAGRAHTELIDKLDSVVEPHLETLSVSQLGDFVWCKARLLHYSRLLPKATQLLLSKISQDGSSLGSGSAAPLAHHITRSLWALCVLQCLTLSDFKLIEPSLRQVWQYKRKTFFVEAAQLRSVLLELQLQNREVEDQSLPVDPSIVHWQRAITAELPKAGFGLTTQSGLHQSVSNALSSLGIYHETETELEAGYIVDIYIKLFDEVTHSERKGIVLEVDGPTHFDSYLNLTLGHTAMKRRHLRELGYQVVSIPYWRVPDQSRSESIANYLQEELKLT